MFGLGDRTIVVLDHDGHTRTIDASALDVVNQLRVARDRPTATVSDFGLHSAVYDLDNGSEIGRIDGQLDVFPLLEGKFLATTLEGDLTLLGGSPLEPVTRLGSLRAFAEQATQSSDGRIVLVRAADQTVSLYDLRTGVRIGDPIEIASDDFNDAELRPDGLEMVVGGGELGVSVWDLDASHWVAAACRIAGRNLTHDEWQTYLGYLGDYRPTCPDYEPSSN